MPFVKLDCGILDSSLWLEDLSTRITFITMLAMARPDGVVEATAPGVARRARIALSRVRASLRRLESDDPDSRGIAPDGVGGRRILRVDGGYLIVNYQRYRERDYTSAERSRRYRASRRVVTPDTPEQTQAEVEAEAEAEADKTTLSPNGDPAHEVLKFLNEKTGRNYRPVKVNLDLIRARMKEGATLEQCRAVIAIKRRQWKGTDMEPYLRPATLFNRTKFAQYVGELPK